MGERQVGTVTHWFGRLGVAAMTLREALRVGDRIRLKGKTTDFTTTVDRMQVDHADVKEAKPGDDVAVHLGQKAREHDAVLKVD
ncbi:MAG: hypothetical protein AUH85_08885 [Chloroflexi bacterium 13_1_40CM_4_68_4]|nr:MAG: hypothetical protein AUH85_08885 [Chloroflexi bacterium 13_1_40CM_4_68_4]